MSAPILIVDEHDHPVGSATKQQAWEQGLWHRIVRIMLEDGKGSVLLQHRSPTKDLYPNCWDNSAAGHVDAGEGYEKAAYRELQEELGMHDATLQEIGSFIEDSTWQGRQLKRFAKVYTATISGTPVSPEPDKIDDVRWFTITDVKRMVVEDPDHVSDGLEQVMRQFY